MHVVVYMVCVCLSVCLSACLPVCGVFVYGHTCAKVYILGSENDFVKLGPPSHALCALGIDLSQSGLCGKCLYPPGHLACMMGGLASLAFCN